MRHYAWLARSRNIQSFSGLLLTDASKYVFDKSTQMYQLIILFMRQTSAGRIFISMRVSQQAPPLMQLVLSSLNSSAILDTRQIPPSETRDSIPINPRRK